VSSGAKAAVLFSTDLWMDGLKNQTRGSAQPSAD
jgi:hypothetical protein